MVELTPAFLITSHCKFNGVHCVHIQESSSCVLLLTLAVFLMCKESITSSSVCFISNDATFLQIYLCEVLIVFFIFIACILLRVCIAYGNAVFVHIRTYLHKFNSLISMCISV